MRKKWHNSSNQTGPEIVQDEINTSCLCMTAGSRDVEDHLEKWSTVAASRSSLFSQARGHSIALHPSIKSNDSRDRTRRSQDSNTSGEPIAKNEARREEHRMVVFSEWKVGKRSLIIWSGDI
ncbi:hypothetical protein K0M31_007740 [Melipona bicolor]|uniref:Uncharacterized protein n=1 Tax=Melipona bicolor TaxID=60889 RepID=A0AA40GCT3_9HYME|nr:hypothetical protein K0M31_007740 [Melipona bicolor]